jgi:AcrR family transcriptional regulator
MAASIALFAEKGYAGTSVREIVDRAKVTKPVLYYYYASKEGTFRAILKHATMLQETILKEALESTGSALQRLITLYRRSYQGVMKNKNLFMMIHNLIYGPPQSVPAYDFEKYHRRMIETIKKIYTDGVAKGEMVEADPEEVALLVLGLIDYCLHFDQVHPEASDPERPERLLKLAFQGLMKK